MIMEKLHRGCKGKISMVLTALCVGGSLGGMLSQPVLASVPEAFSRGFSEIVARVQPAVVNVAVSGGSSPRGGPRRLPPGPFGGPPGPPMPPPGIPRPFGPPGGSAGSGVKSEEHTLTRCLEEDRLLGWSMEEENTSRGGGGKYCMWTCCIEFLTIKFGEY